MNVAGMPTWLEKMIGSNRDATSIAQQLGQHPELIKIIQESIGFAESVPGDDPARIIAEHFASRIHRMFDECKTMH